MLTDRL
jgi:mitochondrial import inner membrane translocase subunit TIM9